MGPRKLISSFHPLWTQQEDATYEPQSAFISHGMCWYLHLVISLYTCKKHISVAVSYSLSFVVTVPKVTKTVFKTTTTTTTKVTKPIV